MIANKLTILTATAALLEPAIALGHRHAHQQHAQKRGEWITATINGQVVSWENNYYGPGGAPPAATQPAAASQPEVPDAPAPAPAQPTTIIKVAKPSQAAKPAYKPAQPKKEEVAAKSAMNGKTQSKAAKSGSSSSGGSAGFSHKRGIVYNDVAQANTYAAGSESFGWAWNWNSQSEGLKGDLAFIPTLWGDDKNHKGDQLAADCAKAVGGGAKAVFSFNEPDIVGQANMSPAKAAKLHQKWLNTFDGKALVGAPSVSNSGEPGQGLAWLKSWIAECDGACKFDFCNVHWYSGLEYGDTLFDHLKASKEACGDKPIWLTEFAPTTGTPDEIASWLEKVLPKLDALDYLDAYSYWKVNEGKLMSSPTQMSKYGKVYASA
ncbi:putative serine-rich protein C13G6.10c [Fusarium austroafricanum]|uniref:Putative serine-rich protein C13G6.10c n=1 Tax=Fusarium austroafricanum TaxID=2364996 RepID=A0A8H4KNZ5_9HYPO|nr:putative serine-rich protein C13G6.10c [Fusarium austroafricanum]